MTDRPIPFSKVNPGALAEARQLAAQGYGWEDIRVRLRGYRFSGQLARQIVLYERRRREPVPGGSQAYSQPSEGVA